ncbi:MAG: 2-oxo acid dehydrogenase subunit E2, partial [Janthinobacterium lividum]
MAIAPGTSTTASSGTEETDFGANDWLLEEMFERFTADPSSVDPSWADYFAAHGAPGGASPSASAAPEPAASKPVAPATAAPKPAAATTPARTNGGPVKNPTSNGSAASTVPRDPAATPTSSSGAGAPADDPVTNRPVSPREETPGQPAPARRQPTVEKPVLAKEGRPTAPGARGGVPADPPNPSDRPEVGHEEPTLTTLRGAPARTAKNMDASLSIPTATSVRSLPVKLLIDQRIVINNHLRRSRGGKVSFTHLVGFAMVQALKSVPAMNNSYSVVNNKPTMVEPAHINLGLAIDLPKPDGTRQLLVPSIKSCETLDFAQFWAAYEAMVAKARKGELAVTDFAGTTITLTNPGTIGTNHSVPRLVEGQGTIIGVGSMDYPAEFQGSSPDKLADAGVSKILTLT